jgi:hypothetical protein
LLISSASSSLVASGFVARAVLRMSSRSRLSHRTYAGLPNWSLGRHRRPLLVLRKRYGCQGRCFKSPAAKPSGRSRRLQDIEAIVSISHRRLLQQNRLKTDFTRGAMPITRRHTDYIDPSWIATKVTSHKFGTSFAFIAGEAFWKEPVMPTNIPIASRHTNVVGIKNSPNRNLRHEDCLTGRELHCKDALMNRALRKAAAIW